MNKLYVHTLVGLICIIFNLSCIYIHITHFTESELRWMQPYQNIDSICYKSNFGNFSTMKSIEVNIYNETNRFYINENTGPNYEAICNVCFDLIQQDAVFSGFFEIEKPVDAENIRVRMILGNRKSDKFIGPGIDLNSKDIFINKRIIKNCMIFNNSNSYYSNRNTRTQPGSIKECIFSKEFGLIQYTLVSGEIYTRRDI